MSRPQPLPPTPAIEDVVDLEPANGSRRTDHPLRGIGLVVLSTFFLACSDVTAKYLSYKLPFVEIGWIRYLVFLGLLAPAVARAGPARVMRSQHPRLQMLRGLMLVISSMFFIASLRFLQIAEATTITFVAPIFVTALSIVFLGETVCRRRWIATCVGLLGVLIVLRPGTSSFQPAAILCIISAFCWACTLAITRKIAGTDSSTTTMCFSAVVGFCVLSALLPLVWVVPTPQQVLFGVTIGIVATTGHWLIVLAYRHADASVLAPFTYSQLVFVTILGFLIFGDIPDIWTCIGAAIIAGSGLYIAQRERLRRKAGD